MEIVKSPKKFVALALVAVLLVSVSAPMVFAQGGSGGGSGSGSGGSGSGGGTPAPAPVVTTTTAAAVAISAFAPASTFVGGAPVTINYALINTGTIPLSLSSIALQDVSFVPQTPSLYTLNMGTCVAGTSIPTGAGTISSPTGANVCNFSVTFNPAVVGTSDGSLINLTFGNAPSVLSTTGITQVLVNNPVASVTGPSAFADTSVGTPMPTKSSNAVIVQNAGGQPLVISDVAISGANAGDFAVVLYDRNLRSSAPLDCSVFGNPVTLSGVNDQGIASRCAIGVAFAASAEGARSATITLTTNDPAHPTISFDLTGNGTPAVVVTPVAAFNVTDRWVSADSNAKLNIVHHPKNMLPAGSDAVVADLVATDINGSVFYSIENGAWTSSTSYTGDVLDLSGAVVGSATLDFTDASNGTLSYTVNSVTTSEAIARAAF